MTPSCKILVLSHSQDFFIEGLSSTLRHSVFLSLDQSSTATIFAAKFAWRSGGPIWEMVVGCLSATSVIHTSLFRFRNLLEENLWSIRTILASLPHVGQHAATPKWITSCRARITSNGPLWQSPRWWEWIRAWNDYFSSWQACIVCEIIRFIDQEWVTYSRNQQRTLPYGCASELLLTKYRIFSLTVVIMLIRGERMQTWSCSEIPVLD